MKRLIELSKTIYFYVIFSITIILLFKSYEYYFFNDFFIKIPNVVDIKYEEAKKIEKKGLKLKLMGEINSIKPIGVICKQKPSPGFLIKRGSSIKVFVSKGIKRKLIPEIKNEDLDEAQKILRKNNILIGNIDFIFNEEVDFNKVIATDPQENTFVPINVKVSLLVSKGSKNKITFIPDVIGLDFLKAKEIFKDESILVRKITYINSEYEKDTILDIFPKVGEKIFRGSYVDLVLSK